jgi:hypothetical protein
MQQSRYIVRLTATRTLVKYASLSKISFSWLPEFVSGHTNVTMHQPSSWIIGFERYDEIARCWQHSSVPPWRVTQGQSDIRGISAGALCEDEEVVPVKMYGMWSAKGCLDHNIYPFVSVR